jgi:hypothetical protein
MFSLQKFVATLVMMLFLRGAHAQVIELSHDKNKNGTSAATLVLSGEPLEKMSAIFIADSTGYGEAFVGTRLTYGSFIASPYVGVEWVNGAGIRPRALVLTSVAVGEFTFNNVNEFGGVTGNFYKTTLSYTVSDKWKTSLVSHSVAGAGMRLDFTPKGVTFYVQVLERRTTVGVVLVQ